MRDVIVYPFPYSQKSNRYIDLLYTAVRRQPGVSVQESSLAGIIVRRLKNPNARQVVHVHWSVMLFGSRFLLKAILKLFQSVILLAILKAMNVRIVWTMHNLIAHDFPYPRLDRLARKFFWILSDVIIIQQKSVADQLAKQYPNKTIRYIPLGNYIDAYGPSSDERQAFRKRLHISEQAVVVLSLGLLRPYKHVEELIDVVIAAQVPELVLVIAGPAKPAYAKSLQVRIADNPAIKLIDTYIPDAEVAGYFALADWSVFWYDRSTLTSASIMLSLSYGVPVACRDVPAADILTNENGFIFKDRASMIAFLKSLPNLKPLSLGQVVDSVRRYDWDEIARQTLQTYVN